LLIFSSYLARYLPSLPKCRVHQYIGYLQTYGPFTRSYEHPGWSALPLEQRAKLLARQGHSFATAKEVRVVYPPGEKSNDEELIDVPRDGKTLGEVVTKGNIVMKEVGGTFLVVKMPIFSNFRKHSISVILKPQKRLFAVVLSGRETWQSGILMDQLLSWIEVRISLYQAAR
jgi:hypothetical protein